MVSDQIADIPTDLCGICPRTGIMEPTRSCPQKYKSCGNRKSCSIKIVTASSEFKSGKETEE